MENQTNLKKKAAHHAVRFIESGMIIGLGTGSTARFAVERLGELLRDGHLQDVAGIPSSLQTEKLARRAAVPLTDFRAHPVIDITIDGADEVDARLNLIKGGGGALLREKVLAQASNRNIIVVDASKMSANLGNRWTVPVEVVPFALRSVENFLKGLDSSVSLRKAADGAPFRTDQNNLILDADFGLIKQPRELDETLASRAGIVEHGIFISLTTDLIIAEQTGIRHLQKHNDHMVEIESKNFH
jgi:ribose 5-phosphate isomerase A